MDSQTLFIFAAAVIVPAVLLLLINGYWRDDRKETERLRAAKYCPKCGRLLIAETFPLEFDPNNGALLEVADCKTCPSHGVVFFVNKKARK